MALSQSLAFLKKLKKNNNREWFQAHRDLYDGAKAEFEAFTGRMIGVLSGLDADIEDSLLPRDCIFRIFRDVRFSKDKSPYKTNFGAFICRGGRKSGFGGYYIHLEPGASFAGGGIYMPPSKILKAIREEIFADPEPLKKILKKPSFKKYFPDFYGTDRLKTAPRGFPKDWPDIELLKNKHYAVGYPLPDPVWEKPRPETELKKIFGAQKEFNQYLNRIVEKAL